MLLNPNDAQALELLFSAYMANRRLEQAESVLQRLEQIGTKDPGLVWRITLARGRLMAARG